MTKTALIVGATGQDGSYLSKYLLEQGIVSLVPVATRILLIVLD